jgi:hypothetical protein
MVMNKGKRSRMSRRIRRRNRCWLRLMRANKNIRSITRKRMRREIRVGSNSHIKRWYMKDLFLYKRIFQIRGMLI